MTGDRETVMDCSRALDNLPLLLSGEVDGATAAALHAHLNECPECHHQLSGQQEVQHILRTYARRESVPLDVQQAVTARVSELCSTRRQQFPAALSRGAAVLALLALAIVLWFPRDQGQRRFAGPSLLQVTVEDHRKTLQGQHDFHVMGPSARQVFQYFNANPALPRPLPIRPAEGPRTRLIGGRSCTLLGVKSAYMVYSHKGHLVSLSVIPDRSLDLSGLRSLQRHEQRYYTGWYQNYNALFWRTPMSTNTLISDLPIGDLMAFANLMGRPLHPR